MLMQTRPQPGGPDRLTTLGALGTAAMVKRLGELARRAMAAGISDVDAITDAIFHALHPARLGRKLQRGEPGFRQLSRQWLALRDGIVRPLVRRLRSLPATPKARPPAIRRGTHEPVPVDQGLVARAFGWSSGSMSGGPGAGSLRRGDMPPDVHGRRRLIVRIGPADVIYLDGSRGWVQSRAGFRSDVNFAALADAGRRGRPLQRLALAEMELLRGIATSVSLPLWLADTGLTATRFVLAHREDFPRWLAAARLFLEARRRMTRHAPNLLRLLERKALAEVARRIPGEITGQQTARFLGQMLGMIVARKLDFSTALRAIRTIGSIAAKVVLPGRAAARLVRLLRREGIAASMAEASRIVRERAMAGRIAEAAIADMILALHRLRSAVPAAARDRETALLLAEATPRATPRPALVL
ncbi:hypothetical protein [Marinimicrococcus flavescens]|uniref:Uncharacterized protein n=1 Tax=Marinimicrococcus flavescens TaxID=3031815 RepID=A0AAP3XT39_9PROT|nr:hypothetical protein [Marinimicrococcus flavescens]